VLATGLIGLRFVTHLDVDAAGIDHAVATVRRFFAEAPAGRVGRRTHRPLLIEAAPAMPDTTQLLVFIAAGWLLNLTPGPDVLYIVSNALRSGVRAGLVAALGIVSGCFVHVFAAALGVSALLATSAMAFTVLKWAGAAYLVWMGVRLLLTRAGSSSIVPTHAGSQVAIVNLWRVYRQGFLTNVLNPKVALFFLAFVPQFIAPGAVDKVTVFLLLGLLFNLNSLPINFGYAWLAGWASRRVGTVQRAMHWMDKAAGLMFIGFGLRLAMSDNPSR
jgi:threonine/homoserine/homoserine lactone efflux protein